MFDKEGWFLGLDQYLYHGRLIDNFLGGFGDGRLGFLCETGWSGAHE